MADPVSRTEAELAAAVAEGASDLVTVPRVLLAAVIENQPGAVEELRELASQQPAPQGGAAFLTATAKALRRFRARRKRSTQLIEENRKLIRAAQDSARRAEIALENLAGVRRMSERDALTDTPNRTLMLDRIECSMVLARREKTRAAILFADLDGFKQINDLLGHAAGDDALRLVPRRFETVVRDSDTVSRHGGDEFLVLLGGLRHPSDAGVIAGKLLAALAQPAWVGNHLLRLRASIGIAIYPDDGDDAATLIDAADAAMFRSKRRAPGGFEYWKAPVVSPASRAAAERRQLSATAQGLSPNDLYPPTSYLAAAIRTLPEPGPNVSPPRVVIDAGPASGRFAVVFVSRQNPNRVPATWFWGVESSELIRAAGADPD